MTKLVHNMRLDDYTYHEIVKLYYKFECKNLNQVVYVLLKIYGDIDQKFIDHLKVDDLVDN